METPSLTVVKLKPKADAAPKLNVETPVVEPAPEMLDALADAPARSTDASFKEAPAEDPEVVEAEFERALTALRTGNLSAASSALQAFAQEHPRHPKADNALYFSGVGLIGLEDYAGAARVLESVLRDYPAGDAVVDSMLKLAECQLRLNRRQEARTLFAQVISQYPGTAAATQAEQRLSSLGR